MSTDARERTVLQCDIIRRLSRHVVDSAFTTMSTLHGCSHSLRWKWCTWSEMPITDWADGRRAQQVASNSRTQISALIKQFNCCNGVHYYYSFCSLISVKGTLESNKIKRLWGENGLLLLQLTKILLYNGTKRAKKKCVHKASYRLGKSETNSVFTKQTKTTAASGKERTNCR